MKFLADKKPIDWMKEHAVEYASDERHYPVYDLASKASYLFAEYHGLGANGDYISYLYYHQAAEVFKELGLDPGKNNISHEASYVNGCQRYH